MDRSQVNRSADDYLINFLETPLFETGLRIIYSQLLSQEENLVGRTIDSRYLIESELPEGGMGKVYLALDQQLSGRHVVIKVLSQASLLDPYLVGKFHQESEALSRIDHPNVVSVIGTGKLDNGDPYIAMQYVEGSTLRSQITSEGMNLERAGSILKQIGAGLSAIHDEGILHRDLKPENVILQVLNDGQELVKIIDFGIARITDSDLGPTGTERPIGTLAYMSPEQLSLREELRPATDIYSMAVIAYEMSAGRRPFSAASGAELLEAQRQGVRVKPNDLRPQLNTQAQAAILKGLSFNSAERYQEANQFGSTLARAVNSRKTLKDSSKLSTNTHTRLWVVGAGLLILFVCSGLLALYSYSKRNQTSLGSAHSFKYWLTVKQTRGGGNYQEPINSNGQNQIFYNGDKFCLNISSAEPGYVYVLSENEPAPNRSGFTLLYPTPVMNDGSATLGANQTMQTDWLVFDGPPGAENIWIVWSSSPVSEVDNVKNEAFKRSDRGLMDQNLVNLKSFLKAKEAEVKVRKTHYKASQTVVVQATSEILVTLIRLEHR